MKKLTLKEFIERARGKHGDKYDYSEAEYTNIDSEVTIICPIHGKFKQIAYDHLKGCGCSKCAAKEIGEKRRISKEEWLKRFKKAHGDKYIYDEAEFKRKQDEIKIICPAFSLVNYAIIFMFFCIKQNISFFGDNHHIN